MTDDAPALAEHAMLFGRGGTLGSVLSPTTGRYLMPDVDIGDRARLSLPPDDDAVTYAILDTGILSGHPLIAPRLTAAVDFTDTDAEDREGHGTQVAIVLICRVSNVRLLSAKVIGSDDAPLEVEVSRIAEGVKWAVGQGACAINLSVGFATPCGPVHRPLCEAVKAAIDSEVFVFVAGEATCPARCDRRVHVVGAMSPQRGRITSEPPDHWAPTWGNVTSSPVDEWLTKGSAQPTGDA